MQTSTEAEENLRVIRSLMEKATIYRAISAPTALIGGLVSVVFGIWLHLKTYSSIKAGEFEDLGRLFLLGWLGVLSVTVVANGVLIWQAARSRNEPFISAAMRKALWALFPPLLCGAVLTLLAAGGGQAWTMLPPIWMTFYGLALLATAQFSPNSIPLLGWSFLSAGLFYMIADHWLGAGFFAVLLQADPSAGPNLLMTSTFGLFHLIYAACTWPRKTGGAA